MSKSYRHHNDRRSRNSRGFTLLEMLLSIALVSVIAGIGIPVYQSLQPRNDLDIAANTEAQTLRRAQVLALASDGDTSWGVSVLADTITLFKGASYAARDGTFDEVFATPNITPTGLAEVVFAKFTGLPQSTGTTTLTNVANETRTITINAKGTITY